MAQCNLFFYSWKSDEILASSERAAMDNPALCKIHTSPVRTYLMLQLLCRTSNKQPLKVFHWNTSARTVHSLRIWSLLSSNWWLLNTTLNSLMNFDTILEDPRMNRPIHCFSHAPEHTQYLFGTNFEWYSSSSKSTIHVV